MNQDRLNEIYKNPITISNSDVDDLRQLAKDYPYFSKPFEILARHYHQTNHYRFEDMLRLAAVRVRDRKLLYEFIHAELEASRKPDSEVVSEIESITPNNLEIKEPVLDEKLGLDAFLDDKEMLETAHMNEADLQSLEVSEADNEGINETPFEFEGTYKLHETVTLIEEQDIIGEEIATEFSFTKSFVHDEEQVESGIAIVEQGEEKEIVLESISEEEKEIDIISEEEPLSGIVEVESNATEELEGISEHIEREIVDVPVKRSELDLRKYPVYSIETFVPQAETENLHELDSSKDFFSWLKNPKHAEELPLIEDEIKEVEAEVSNEKVSKSLDIIEKFISINPQISRPKKEFFSPENMAKRSEVLDLEFVSETLAEIYYQQGNFDFAIKAYEKLSLQNPSKQSFFADLIDKIKKERK
jgi:hypothetical protein